MNIQGRDFMAACERLENLLKNNERENLKPKTALNAFLDSFREFQSKLEVAQSFQTYSKLFEAVDEIKEIARKEVADLQLAHNLEIQKLENEREKNNVEKGAQAALIGDVSSQLLSLLNNIEVTPASLDLKDLVAGVECWIIHTNERLSEENAIQEKLSLSNARVSVVENEIHELGRKMAVSIDELSKSKELNGRLENEILHSKATIYELREKATNNELTISSQSLEISRLSEEKGLTIEKISELSSDKESLVELMAELNSKLECLIGESASNQRELTTAKDISKFIKKSLERVIIREGVAETFPREQCLAELVESLKADVLKVIENMEEAALKISQLSIENAALRSFSNDLEENNINLSKSNDDLDFKIKERESRLSTWERIICESLKPFHDLMEKDEKQCTPTTQFETFERFIEKLLGERTLTRRTIEELHRKVNHLSSLLKKNEKKRNILINSLTVNRALASQKSSENQKLSKAILSMRFEKEEYSDMCSLLRQTISKLQSKYSAVVLELSEERAETSNLRSENVSIQNCANERENAIKSLAKSQVNDLERKIDDQASEINSLQAENKSLKMKLVDVYPSLQEQCNMLAELDQGGTVSENLLFWESRPDLVGLSPLEVKLKINWDELNYVERYILNENCLKEALKIVLDREFWDDKSADGESDVSLVDMNSRFRPSPKMNESFGPIGLPENDASPLAKVLWRDTRAQRGIIVDTPEIDLKKTVKRRPHEVSSAELKVSDERIKGLIKKPRLVVTVNNDAVITKE